MIRSEQIDALRESIRHGDYTVAALREPSAAVIRMASHYAYNGLGYRMPDDVLAALVRVAVDEAEQQPVGERAAVVAAEQEVDRE